MNARQKDNYKKSPETLMKAILSMKKKLEADEKRFQGEPLMLWVEMGDGHVVPRANPFVQEYRAMVRDFSAALKAYEEITASTGAPAEVTSLEELRARFKVAK